jgi:peptide/nickel transport system substrate-binding protein
MFKRQTTLQTLIKLIMLALILAGCQPTSTPEPAVATMVVTEVVEATPVETVQVIQVMTPTPEPTGPRTLVICLGAEPAELRVIGWGYVMSGAPIKQALFEGGGMRPIDFKSYSYQPIIFEKKPSLADGDAALTVVAVDEGDLVVDVDNNVITLDPNADPPQMLAPAGGGDPVPYRGGEFQMVKLSLTFKMLPNLMWSDGYPLTASDSVYGFNLWADPDFGMPSIYTERTASYEAIDELTLVWTGLPGHLSPIYDVSFWQPAPEHLWGKYSTAELLES